MKLIYIYLLKSNKAELYGHVLYLIVFEYEIAKAFDSLFNSYKKNNASYCCKRFIKCGFIEVTFIYSIQIPKLKNIPGLILANSL